MLKIKTNLKLIDYEDLMFDNYFSKSRKVIEEKYKKTRAITHKAKDFKIKIDNKTYDGEILSYPIVMEYRPNDYTLELWKFEVKAVFKIIIKVNIKDEDMIKKLNDEQVIYIDRKKCYMGQHEFKGNTIYFTFITFENMQKSTYTNLDLVEKVE